jgi:membrane protease YdiL (CAAX protease family)
MSHPSSSRSSLISLFVGPHGLRAGWRFVLFVLGIELSEQFLEGPIATYVIPRLGITIGDLSAPALLFVEVAGFFTVLLVTGVAALLERRRIDGYGLPLRQAFGLLFWKGMVAGFLVVVFVGNAMVLTGGMQIHGLALSGTTLFSNALLWLGAMILVGLNEEYLFRGYALQSLWRGAGFWPAALITTAIFAGLHMTKPHENAMDIGMIFVLGLALCLSIQRTGSLWWAVGWHTAFDFGQFFIIGTHNGGQSPVGHLFNVTFLGPAWINGGELGTEASAFMIPAALATYIYVDRCLRSKGGSAAPSGDLLSGQPPAASSKGLLDPP